MNYKTLQLIAVFCVLFIPGVLLAQSGKYTPLVGIPGIDPGAEFGTYINALYALSISVAALLAVIKIIIAGMKYMLSDIVTSKSDALADIRGSITGLIVVISAVLILTVINPQLTETSIYLAPVQSAPGVAPIVTPGTVTAATGYSYVKAGSIPTFEADCANITKGKHQLASDSTGTQIQVCYSPLPPAFSNELDTLYGGKGLNMTTIKDRYQTVLYPKLIGSGVLPVIPNATTYMAVTYTEPQDWIEKASMDAMTETCRNLSVVTPGKNIRVDGSSARGYLACVSFP
jgi:hypothetical protein